jgi:hypothetical protein
MTEKLSLFAVTIFLGGHTVPVQDEAVEIAEVLITYVLTDLADLELSGSQ